MKFKARIDCAFDHFRILGLARILQDRWDTPIFLQWTGINEVELSGGRLDAPDIANAQKAIGEALCKFVDEVYDEDKGVLIKKILVDNVDDEDKGVLVKMIRLANNNPNDNKKTKFSPFSPHKKLDSAADVRRSWNKCREEFLDEARNDNTLVQVLISCLGKPNWWVDNPKGGNHWEITPSNKGSDFVGRYVNKITREIVKDFKDANNKWEVEKVYQSLIEEGIGEQNAFRKTLGLKSPNEFATYIQGWCAIWGFAQFACRPVTPSNERTKNAEPNTLGVVIPEGIDGERFVLPVPDKLITVSRYCAILRSRKLYRCPVCWASGKYDVDWEGQRNLLRSLGISHVALFKKLKVERVKTPEYYLFGKMDEIYPLDKDW